MKESTLIFVALFSVTTLFSYSLSLLPASSPFLSDSNNDDLPANSASLSTTTSSSTRANTGGNVDLCNSHMCQHEYNINLASLLAYKTSKNNNGYPGAAGRSSSATSLSDDKLCPIFLAYNQCMKTLSKSCRGNLEYHTVITAVRRVLEKSNCTGSHHKSRQGMRSSSPTLSETERALYEAHRKQVNEQRRIARCINEVLNFTFDHENYIKNQEQKRLRALKAPSTKLRPPFKRKDEILELQRNALSRSERSPSRGRKKSFNNNNGPPLLGGPNERDLSKIQEDASSISVNSERFFQSDGESITAKDLDDEEEDECEDDEECGNSNGDQVLDDPLANFKSMYERDEEPLLCSIFGDPHVRTFTNRFQTCQIQGAWPMMDHPLFAVQVTSSKDSSTLNHIPGITKVTVLVRQIMICGIERDLVYEADLTTSHINQGEDTSFHRTSSGQTDDDDTDQSHETSALPITFSDGSSSTKSGLVKVTARSNHEVCIQLDHVGVQVCVRKFISSKYLNVIVKFKKHMSSEERSLMIDSMDSYTLCTIGCPSEEQVNVPKILSAVGIDVFNESLYVNECEGLYGYYWIACIFDVKMKGSKGDQIAVHRFAQEMDDILVVKRTFTSVKLHYLASSSTNVHLTYTLVQLVNLIGSFYLVAQAIWKCLQ